MRKAIKNLSVSAWGRIISPLLVYPIEVFHLKNASFLLIAVVTAIFSILSVSGSQADVSKYSFPAENADYSTVAWAENEIDENGRSFYFDYSAWDIGRIGLRMSYDSLEDDSTIELHIIDSENEQICEYSARDLYVDPEGVTWMEVGKHVEAGNIELLIKGINTAGLKVVGYTQDGVLDKNGNPATCLNMQVETKTFPKTKAYAFSIVWLLILFAGIILIKNRSISFERLFIVTYIIMGIMAFMIFPPFAEPDCGNHYRRTYAISENVFLPELDENNAIGGMFAWPSTWGGEDSIQVSWSEADNRMSFDVTDPNNARYLTYTNIALYSPVCHIVPALGMKIARLFTNSFILIVMTARVFNYIAIGILLYLGIRIAPFGKEYFLWIILHPFMMKLYTSISPDVMTAALVYLLTAVVLRLRYDPNAYAKKGYLAALYVIPLLLGQFKIVYVAFCILLFLIPKEKFASKKSYYMNAAAIGAVTMVPAFIWLKISSHILSVGYARTNEPNTQIVLSVFKYIPVLLNTFVKKGYDYIMQFFGSTLVFKESTNNAVVLVFLILVTGLIARNMQSNMNNLSEPAVRVRKDLAMKAVIVAAIAITAILIFTAEYIQWTEPGASIVDGVSGRYFFPFIFPALILFTGMADTKEIDGEVIDVTGCKKLFSLAAIVLCFASQLYIVYRL
ncbi:MAG: DUF2142 domain-containing protein [Butyrivibrio sp.]|nr:DUF2142 domain-containing protein [Butyrivibrio sp.]